MEGGELKPLRGPGRFGNWEWAVISLAGGRWVSDVFFFDFLTVKGM